MRTHAFVNTRSTKKRIEDKMYRQLPKIARTVVKKIVPKDPMFPRTNRMWIFLHLRDGRIQLLSPSFFMHNMREKDKNGFFEPLSFTRRRLKKALFPGMSNVPVHSVGSYPLETSSPCRTVHTMLLQEVDIAQLPKEVKAHLVDFHVEYIPTRVQRRIGRKILERIQEHAKST